ncbi:MAG: hypothetical protein ACE5HB_10140 [Terriglobia bacterium]
MIYLEISAEPEGLKLTLKNEENELLAEGVATIGEVTGLMHGHAVRVQLHERKKPEATAGPGREMTDHEEEARRWEEHKQEARRLVQLCATEGTLSCTFSDADRMYLESFIAAALNRASQKAIAGMTKAERAFVEREQESPEQLVEPLPPQRPKSDG